MPEEIQPDQVMAQLERIVTTAPLESSPSLCRLLRYVVVETLAGRGSSLKEYSLGVVVFDRGEEFDPRLDPIVRVQARNLRVRLGQYYQDGGSRDPVLIELPKRTYVPVFRHREEEAQAETAVVVVPETLPELERPRIDVVTTPPIPVSIAKARSTRSAMFAGVLVGILGTAAFWMNLPQAARSAGLLPHDADPVAQDLYIRGRVLMDRQTESGIRDSISYFRQAVERDPRFAPAYTGLADAYNVLAQYGYIAPADGMREARRAAERALEINPTLAEAHVSLAAIIEAYDWNWSGAEREYKRALELNPQLASAHLWYGMFLRDQGRLNEALPELRRAATLEPFSVLTSINLAHGYMMAGNYSAALEEAKHAAEMAPALVTAHVVVSNAYRAQSRVDEAEAALERAKVHSTDNPHGLSVLAMAYGRHGNREESVRLFHQLEELSKQRYVSPYDMGTVSLVLGEEKRGLDLLEEAFRQRSSGLIFLRSSSFAKTRKSPQLDELIRKMKFAG